MKKTGIILSLTILIVLSAASVCFAEPLKLEDTYPRDGYENAAIDNFGIKLYFNQDVINAENEEANKDCFVITDDEGKEVPTMVIYSDKEEGMLMVLADMTDEDLQIKQNSEYTLTIAGDFTAASGETLGEEQTIKVKTLDQAKASRINVIMMVIMMVGMIFFGRQTDKKQEEKKKVEEKVNPYKVAKETGKSVEEIVEAENKKKEKKAAAEAKKAKKEMEDEDTDDEEEEEQGNPYAKHVKSRARAVRAAENSYVSKREEERKKQAAAMRLKGTTNPKKSGGKKRKR